MVKQAIEAMGGNRELFIRLLNTTSANLNRYYHKKVLSPSDSEEVLDTLRVYRAAVRIFGNETMAREWLATNCLITGQRILIQTPHRPLAANG